MVVCVVLWRLVVEYYISLQIKLLEQRVECLKKFSSQESEWVAFKNNITKRLQDQEKRYGELMEKAKTLEKGTFEHKRNTFDKRETFSTILE